MRKILPLLLILTILFTSFNSVSAISNDTYFTDVEVYKIENNQAYLKWATYQEPTKGFIYFGQDSNNLDRFFGYGVYDYRHESILTGIEKNKTYYFKIVSYNQAGQTNETFLNSFSTKNMKDTIAPEFISANTIQVTGDAVALRWVTDEDTSAQIYYGTDYQNLDKKKDYTKKEKIHELFIYDLDIDQKYYIRIEAADEAKNKRTQTLNFRTKQYLTKQDSFEIYDIKPLNFDPNYIFYNGAKIHWQTNFVAKSKIHYGTEPGKYTNHIDVNVDKRSLVHDITLTDLTPNTTYYYKIEVYDSLYNKKDALENLTFTTSSFTTNAPAPTVINRNIDSDLDGLTDGYEMDIGTDPLRADTDGDTYNDRLEIIHGYDPLIPGSTQNTKLQSYRYFMPKRSDAYELAKLQELKSLVQQQLGYVQVSTKNWNTLNRAYIYGGYPLQSIIQAIKFGGKTVHPTINWHSWQETPQYKEYINK